LITKTKFPRRRSGGAPSPSSSIVAQSAQASTTKEDFPAQRTHNTHRISPRKIAKSSGNEDL
jgi:hypothetical protein